LGGLCNVEEDDSNPDDALAVEFDFGFLVIFSDSEADLTNEFGVEICNLFSQLQFLALIIPPFPPFPSHLTTWLSLARHDASIYVALSAPMCMNATALVLIFTETQQQQQHPLAVKPAHVKQVLQPQESTQLHESPQLQTPVTSAHGITCTFQDKFPAAEIATTAL
jgi:hypothetical protein